MDLYPIGIKAIKKLILIIIQTNVVGMVGKRISNKIHQEGRKKTLRNYNVRCGLTTRI